jgi:hypothetical protein
MAAATIAGTIFEGAASRSFDAVGASDHSATTTPRLRSAPCATEPASGAPGVASRVRGFQLASFERWRLKRWGPKRTGDELGARGQPRLRKALTVATSYYQRPAWREFPGLCEVSRVFVVDSIVRGIRASIGGCAELEARRDLNGHYFLRATRRSRGASSRMSSTKSKPVSLRSVRYSASVLSLASDSQATIIVKSFINAKVEAEKSGFSTLSLISSVPRPVKASWQLLRILRQLESLQS